MREELSKYLKLTRALIDLDMEAEEAELPNVSLLTDARDRLIKAIKKLSLSAEEKREFMDALIPLEEALEDKLRKSMEDTQANIDEIKKLKSSKFRTRTALANYEGRREDINSVFFDKNT